MSAPIPAIKMYACARSFFGIMPAWKQRLRNFLHPLKRLFVVMQRRISVLSVRRPCPSASGILAAYGQTANGIKHKLARTTIKRGG